MKPEEFDDLIRQQFYQNDLEYNPNNWEKLSRRMEEKPKRRTILVWWTPLIGIAASLSLSVGIASYMQYVIPPSLKKEIKIAHIKDNRGKNYEHYYKLNDTGTSTIQSHYANVSNKAQKPLKEAASPSLFNIRMSNVLPDISMHHAKNKIDINLLEKAKEPDSGSIKLKKKIKSLFNQDEVLTQHLFSNNKNKKFLFISGGLNHGNDNDGFTLACSGRRMISNQLFIEGDLAFTQSTQYGATLYLDNSSNMNTEMALGTSASKITSEPVNQNVYTPPNGTIKSAKQAYALMYAQCTPTLGYKLSKRISLAAGPDFQQMLVDNRPAPSTVDKNNISVAPVFDLGFIGKTEFAITKNCYAGLSYRKGINNFITPMDKYLDRDYLQFQIKCGVFNK